MRLALVSDGINSFRVINEATGEEVENVSCASIDVHIGRKVRQCGDSPAQTITSYTADIRIDLGQNVKFDIRNGGGDPNVIYTAREVRQGS